MNPTSYNNGDDDDHDGLEYSPIEARWTPKTDSNESKKQLRRPLVNTSAEMAGRDESNDVAKVSNLSADAQEFYPRGHPRSQDYEPMQQQQAIFNQPAYIPTDYHHQWNSQHHIGYSSMTSEPFPQHMMSTLVMPQHAVINNYQYTDLNSTTTTANTPHSWSSKQHGSPTEQLKSAMTELTLNPGEFDNLVMPLGDTFCQWLTEPEITKSVVSLIIEHSISEPNFRYTGARLLNLLNNLESPADRTSDFIDVLINKCREEHEKAKDLFKNNVQRLHSFTLFLAELFIQLEKKGEASESNVLGEFLFDQLCLLLSEPKNDNVKCACQVLKLAGMQVEQVVTASKMDTLESQLQNVMSSPELSQNMCALAKSVINLREQSWGRSPSSPTPPVQWSSGQDAPPSNHLLCEGVFYGPDGQILSAEETRFLQDADEAGSSEGEYDEGMDEELQEAYEKFLQMPQHRPT